MGQRIRMVIDVDKDDSMVSQERFDEMRSALQARVKHSRYMHSLGVSQTAEQLARIYGANENDAAVAGLLHDWDKGLSFEELNAKAKTYHVVKKKVRKNLPAVLHGYTAAATLRDDFPELTDEQLQAIARHTCGDTDMTDLDMIVFIADIIEPGRNFGDVAPLRDAVGRVSLEELFYLTYQSTLIYLIDANMPVHPDSLKVWNYYAARIDGRAVHAALKDESTTPDMQG